MMIGKLTSFENESHSGNIRQEMNEEGKLGETVNRTRREIINERVVIK
jgi:hypothetical protein